jgi:hypothetical protein
VTTQFEEIKKAHHALMAEYVTVLNEVSKLPFFIDVYQVGEPRPLRHRFRSKSLTRTYNSALRLYFLLNAIGFRLFSNRYFLRLLVESHVKRKLEEIKIAYTQLSQSLPDEASTSEFMSWLKNTRDTCNEFSGTLFSWQSIPGLFTAFISFLGSFGLSEAISQSFKSVLERIAAPLHVTEFLATKTEPINPVTTNPVEEIQQFPDAWSSVRFLFYFLPLLAVIFLNYSCKRILFLHGENDHIKRRNVYETEDKLFAALGRGKSREFPIDLLAIIIFIIAIAYLLTLREWTIFSVVLAQANGFEPSGSYDMAGVYRDLLSALYFPIIKVVIVMLTAGIPVIYLLKELKHRQWR